VPRPWTWPSPPPASWWSGTWIRGQPPHGARVPRSGGGAAPGRRPGRSLTMGPTIIARNYAETLLALAERHGGESTVDQFGEAIEGWPSCCAASRASGVPRDPGCGRVAPSSRRSAPRSTARARRSSSASSWWSSRSGGRGSSADRRRVPNARGRAARPDARRHHALARAGRGAAPRDHRIARAPLRLAHRRRVQVDPDLIGGVVIRVGDQILDGSFRRRVSTLRRRLFEARIPQPVAG
jgi:hypothetical protein